MDNCESILLPSQVLTALPELGAYEVRLNHRVLLEATVSSLALPKEVASSVMHLLCTAGATSPAHGEARAKAWPSIRAGLDGLQLDAGPVSRCRQCVLQLPGAVCMWVLRSTWSSVASLPIRDESRMDMIAGRHNGCVGMFPCWCCPC